MDVTAIVQSFIISRTADGCSPRTLQDYRRVLEPFAAWCAAGHLDLRGLNREAVRCHVAALRERGWSESTVAIHVRNLRAFLRGATRRDTRRRTWPRP